MSLNQQDVARCAAQDALNVARQYGTDDCADALGIYAASFVFMLARVRGSDEAIRALQLINRRFGSRQHQKIRLAIDNVTVSETAHV